MCPSVRIWHVVRSSVRSGRQRVWRHCAPQYHCLVLRGRILCRQGRLPSLIGSSWWSAALVVAVARSMLIACRSVQGIHDRRIRSGFARDEGGRGKGRTGWRVGRRKGGGYIACLLTAPVATGDHLTSADKLHVESVNAKRSLASAVMRDRAARLGARALPCCFSCRRLSRVPPLFDEACEGVSRIIACVRRACEHTDGLSKQAPKQ